MTFKELFKLIVLGDTKRPPKLGHEKFNTNSRGSSFSYEYGSYKHSYGNKHYWIRFRLSKDDFSTAIYWNNFDFNWNILISDGDESLDYVDRYYDLKYEIKNLIDFVCALSKHEYRKQNRRNKIALAAKEVRIFRNMNKKIKDMESDFYTETLPEDTILKMMIDEANERSTLKQTDKLKDDYGK